MRTDIALDEDGESHTVFGIDALDCFGQVIKSVPDIFFDRGKAESFIDLCNSQKLEFVHLMDVIYDILI